MPVSVMLMLITGLLSSADYASAMTASCSPFEATPDNIYWERDVVDGADLYERLQSIEIILQQPQGLPLRLLVIDSIAHLFRDIGDQPDTSAYTRRTGMLFRISAILRRFADSYNLVVVVTNQVCVSLLAQDSVCIRTKAVHQDAKSVVSYATEGSKSSGLSML